MIIDFHIHCYPASLASAAISLRCFGSVHPDLPEALEELYRIGELGLYGVKLHLSFQMFEPIRKRYFPLYEEIARLGLPTLFHCDCCSADVPHLGGLWNNVTHDNLEQLSVLEELPVYVDTGFCVNYFSDAEVCEVLSRLKPGRVLYGSDTPWIDARMQLEQLLHLGLDLPAWSACSTGSPASC